jgi:hypothetical protein
MTPGGKFSVFCWKLEENVERPGISAFFVMGSAPRLPDEWPQAAKPCAQTRFYTFQTTGYWFLTDAYAIIDWSPLPCFCVP